MGGRRTLMAPLAALGIGLLALGAGSRGQPDRQRDQITACRAVGQLALLKSGQKWSEDSPSSPGNIYVSACMSQHGYDFNFAGKFCQPTFTGGEVSNPYCYRSHTFPFWQTSILPLMTPSMTGQASYGAGVWPPSPHAIAGAMAGF